MKSLYLKMFFSSSIVLFVALAAFGQNGPPPGIKTVAKVDLQRYTGKWYEIAKYPNRFQKQCVGNTTANYTLKPNGRIEVRNECMLKNGTTEKAVGEAKIVDKKTNAKLKVRFAPSALSFLPFVWGDYWIIDLDENYGYVAVGEPKREYFWILSRRSTMDDATFQNILRRAEAMGFNPAKVEKSPQNAEVLKGTVIVKQ
jgi:apolipoprotein D and lipocalin family protein